MKARSIGVLALAGVLVAGCASDEPIGRGTAIGTGAGVVAGALIGQAIGGNPGATVAGAVIGGILGGAVGTALDERDRRFAAEAQLNALEYGRSGASVGWRNPDSGRYGNVIPGPAYQRQGSTCREYTHTIYIEGRPEVARGVACRNPDGTWQPVG